jgi:hypothetical protein
LITTLLCPALAGAQQPSSKSAALASELVTMLDQMKLEAVAANRGAADEYVGALYLPGSQLLVISAKSSVPDRMKYLLIEKSYKDLYLELNGTIHQDSKVFITDMGINGLLFKPARNQPADAVDAKGKATTFDGEWRKAKLSEADYTKAYQDHDEAYSDMLRALIGTLKASSPR